MKSRTKAKKVNPTSPVELIIYVESARGLLDLRDICQHSVELSEYTNIRLAGVVFGSDDFCANIGFCLIFFVFYLS